MPRRFVGEAIEPAGEALVAGTMGQGEPGLPAAFLWRERTLTVAALVRVWRSTKEDRGDFYLAKHWFAFDTTDGVRAEVYFERHAKRLEKRWYLYTIEEGEATSTPER